MSLFGFFGGDSASSSSTSTTNYDQKIGASDSAVAQRVENASGGTVILGSDRIASESISSALGAAQLAVNSAHAGLVQTETFLGEQLTKLYTTIDNRAKSAEQNIAAAQQLAGDAVTKTQQTSTDDFIKMLMIVGGIGVAVYAMKAGIFK